MKVFLILLIGLTILFYSCKKDNVIKDYKESVIGTYSGIEVTTYWIDTIVGYGHVTSNVILTLTLTMSGLDSVIDLRFNPAYSNGAFSFKFKNGLFSPTTYSHPPILELSKDSLYFRHQPGLGPYWTECFTKKN